MEQEHFKPIKDFETYGISQYGNVKDFRSGKLIPQFVNEKCGGYLQVAIRNENGYKTDRVHRLVGENLINNPNNLEELDHIDRDRLNNKVDNLRWVTKSDNQLNRLGKSHDNNPYRCIHYEDLKTPKNPYSSWCIQIRNQRIKYKKRFRTDKYSLEEVKKIRDDIFRENEIPIND